MPSIIVGGALNINAPQANSGCFVGSYNLAGWDANAKKTSGGGGMFGNGNIIMGQKNVAFDHSEMVDGVINDQDLKHYIAKNV